MMQPFLALVIGKLEKNGTVKAVGAKSGPEKEVWIECKLDVGEYIIYTNVFSNITREDKDITISAYGED